MAPRDEQDEMELEQAENAKKGKSRFNWSTFAVAAGILGAQVIIVGLVMWLSSGPDTVDARPMIEKDGGSGVIINNGDVEELIIMGKATNTKRGATFFYRYKIYVIVSRQDLPAVREAVEMRKATLENIVRRVVARLEPKHLDDEPELVTLRRMLSEEFDQIFGPGTIKQLLVPEWTGIRADY